MKSIAVSFVYLIIYGIPQSLLTVLSLHVFARTKIDVKKYFTLSFIFLTATYLIRFLPIALGVNSVLSLLVLIIAFQLIYGTQLSRVIRTIVSVAVSFILIAVAEVLNMLLLIVIFGQARGEKLFTSEDGLIRGLTTSPTNILFGIFILIGYMVLKQVDKRKKENGETGAKTGE